MKSKLNVLGIYSVDLYQLLDLMPIDLQEYSRQILPPVIGAVLQSVVESNTPCLHVNRIFTIVDDEVFRTTQSILFDTEYINNIRHYNQLIAGEEIMLFGKNRKFITLHVFNEILRLLYLPGTLNYLTSLNDKRPDILKYDIKDDVVHYLFCKVIKEDTYDESTRYNNNISGSSRLVYYA